MATGINIFRTAAFKRGKKAGDSPPRDLYSSLYVLFQLVKERLKSDSVFGIRQIVKNSLAFQF